MAGDALRARWSGLSDQAKGRVLTHWGKWTNDPETMANDVVDLMQGKLERYLGSAAGTAGSAGADVGIALGDEAADNARRSLATLFAQSAP